MNYKWNYETLSSERRAAAEAMATEVGLHPALGQVLLARGVQTVEEAQRFLHPQLQDLHDPFLFKDMQKAVDRINHALGRKERILVYGDYDVDGCTAVALVYRFLQNYTHNLDFYIPDRYDEGYGVSLKGIDRAHEKGVSLIIVLDCGIKAIEEVEYAKSLGIDFIICDHHVPDDELPPAVAILNAKRTDATYPYEHLSGCGVGFKLMQGFAVSNGIPFSKLVPLLDLCAVSIAADLVPILGENRILAYHGLRQINSHPSTGLEALIEICGLRDRDIAMSDIVFKIGPRINASGRMHNGGAAVALLVERDFDVAHKKALQINAYNDQRRDLDKDMTKQANTLMSRLESEQGKSSIVIYNPEWHKGVIGIVASRLTEVYCKPAVVLTRSGDFATGSARSVADFDVYSAIETCRDLLENFGGHTYAAGLTMRVEHVPEFTRRFESYIEQHILPQQIQPELAIDGVLDFKDINHQLFVDIKRLAPYGPENQKPLFYTNNVFDYGTSRVVGHQQEHIKLELVDSKSSIVLNGIAFGQSEHARMIKTKQAFDICYSIESNSHKRGDIQLQIEDIRAAESDC